MISPFLTFPAPLAPQSLDGKQETKEQPAVVPLDVWNKPDRDYHIDWEDGGDECEEFEVPDSEKERGRVSLPGSRPRFIKKNMLIAVDCDDEHHAFYVAEVIKIRRWSMYLRLYGDKFLKAYQPSWYEEKGERKPWFMSQLSKQWCFLIGALN